MRGDFLKLVEEKNSDPCWKDYQMVGTKK